MLGVLAVAAGSGQRPVHGHGQCGRLGDLAQDGHDLVADVVRREQLAEVGGHLFLCAAHPAVRLLGAVAQAYRPLRRVLPVVGQLLDALRGDRRKDGVRVRRQPLEVREAPAGEHQQPDDGEREVAVGQFGQAYVAKVAGVAEVGVGVLVASGAVGLAGAGVEQAGLAEEVEADVGQRHLLLQLGGAGDPLAQTLCSDQGVVGQRDADGGEFTGVDALGHGGVDAVQRVLEAGAVGPAGVVVVSLGEGHVDVVVTHALSFRCAGRRRGCRRTSGGGRPCRRWARRTGPSRRGSRR